MANSIPGEAGKRVHAAFRELTAEFSVNISDITYQMKRDVAQALRQITPKHDGERAELNAFADNLDRSAEALLTGERRG
jgi:hypothetical protein